MSDDIGSVAGDIDDLLASHVLDAEARRRLTEIRDRLEAAATGVPPPSSDRRGSGSVGPPAPNSDNEPDS